MTNLYSDLDVPKNADQATIKKAYRRKAQKANPDKGGDKAKFYAIQKAYDVLGNEERRKRYDENGDTAQQQPVDLQAIGILSSLLIQIVEQVNIDHQNIVDIARQKVNENISQMKKKMESLEESIRKREKTLKRIICKPGKTNVLEQILKHGIGDHKSNISSIEGQIEVLQKVNEFLSDYDYKAEPAPRMGPTISSMAIQNDIINMMRRQSGFI